MRIICDFDGTAAQNDVGNLLFRTFADGRCHDIIRMWKAGEINSRECLQQECDITRVTREQLLEFIDAQKLDPIFPKFVRFCDSNDIEVEIASDGLDFYIKRILENHELGSAVKVKANRLIFSGDERLAAEFPYFEKGCGHCGNCKGYHVAEAKKKGHFVLYVGDGWSDRCGARAADFVLAKKKRELVTYCRENDIAHCEFGDFSDVIKITTELLAEATF